MMSEKKITLEPSFLVVFSSLATDMTAGLILLLPSVKDAKALTGTMTIAILCLVVAVKMERIKRQYD